MSRVALACSVLWMTGCSLLPAMAQSQRIANVAASTTEGGPSLEPGLFDVDVRLEAGYYGGPNATNRMTVTYGGWLQGPFQGRVIAAVLERDGKPVARDESLGLMILNLDATKAARVGEGKLVGNRLVPQGARADFTLDATTPGVYALAFEVRPELRAGQPLPDRTVRLEDAFAVELVPGTGDAPVPTIAPSWYRGRAMLRLNENTLGQFWMTLPTDLRLEKSRIDVLVYAQGTLQGRFTRDLAHSGSVADRPLAPPLEVWGWPAELPMSRVLATPGPWEIHVIQDGTYVTTCGFSVENGRIGGPISASRRLQCAPRSSGTVSDALRLARTIKGYRPTGFRAKEVIALHRSKEVRDFRRKLEAEARAGAGLIGEEQTAEQAKYEATNDREWTRASAKQQEAHQLGQQVRGSMPQLRKQYEALVEKYGR